MNRFKKTSYLYDWISCVIPDRIYFGPLPNEYMIEELKEKKFNLIVNLTEKNHDYDVKYIHFPIIDNSVPSDNIDYCKFIVQLKKEYENGAKMYVHCRAGHSRSSMVIVSLLFCIYNYELKDLINKVISLHRSRVRLREIWKYKSPFNYKQFSFLCMIHKNVYINVGKDSKMYNWLSPKNILVKGTTLEDCITKNLDFDVKENQFLLNQIKKTYLKKLTFIDENFGDFYNHFFKCLRENIL
jgi:protein-tyrosine phosphatase